MMGKSLRCLRWMMILCVVLTFQAAAEPDCLLPEGIHLGPLVHLRKLDGYFLGRDVCLYDPSLVSPERVPAFRGSHAPQNGPTLFYINGANGSPLVTSVNIAALVERSQISVVGIFYYTNQLDAADFTRYIPSGPAVRTLKGVIDASLARREAIYIHADSAGTAVVSEAIGHVADDLKRNSRRHGDWLQSLDLLHVETVGALVKSFPDGPRYVHYINRRDLIPKFGIERPAAHPGAHAVMAYFSERDLPSPKELRQQQIGLSNMVKAEVSSERPRVHPLSDDDLRQQLAAISSAIQQWNSPDQQQIAGEQVLLSFLKSEGLDDGTPIDTQKYLHIALLSLLKFGPPAVFLVINPQKFLANEAIKTVAFLAKTYRSVHRSLAYDPRRRPFDDIYSMGSATGSEISWVNLDELSPPGQGL